MKPLSIQNFSTLFIISIAPISMISCGKKTIDLKDYIVPSESTTLVYDDYVLDEYGSVFLAGTLIRSWVINNDNADVIFENGKSSSIAFNKNDIVFDAGDNNEYSMLRNTSHGALYTDSDGDNFSVYGAYNDTKFILNGTDITRTDNNALILIYRIPQDIFADIQIRYYVKGTGMIGSNHFENCPIDISLNPDTNYASLCELGRPGSILVNQ